MDEYLGPSSPEILAQKVADIFTPKEEELEYDLNKDELIQLCRQKKCCVRMDRWNPIYEFYWQLKRRGRLENKPPQKVQKLLIKLGNRYKNDPNRSYSQNIIDEDRFKAWQLRKSWNVRWLNDIGENPQVSSSEKLSCSDSDLVVISQPSNENQLPIEVEKGPPTYMKNINYKLREILGSEENILDSERLNSTEESAADTSNSKINSLGILQNAVEEVVGSESFQNLLTQSQSPQPALLFEGNSENYETFHLSIPLTSTQSQERE